MSVLIKGMEMPKDCKNCPFLCDYFCRALMLEPDWGRSGRDGRCPLVPVPPHGRLIDADALIDDIRRHSESYFADDFAHAWVDKAPTIIPPEEGE